MVKYALHIRSVVCGVDMLCILMYILCVGMYRCAYYMYS